MTRRAKSQPDLAGPASRAFGTVRRRGSMPETCLSRATSWRSVRRAEASPLMIRERPWRSSDSRRCRSRCSRTVPGPRMSRFSSDGRRPAICATNRSRCSRRCGSPASCGLPPPPWRTVGSCRTWPVARRCAGTSDSTRSSRVASPRRETRMASRASIQTRVTARVAPASPAIFARPFIVTIAPTPRALLRLSCDQHRMAHHRSAPAGRRLDRGPNGPTCGHPTAAIDFGPCGPRPRGRMALAPRSQAIHIGGSLRPRSGSGPQLDPGPETRVVVRSRDEPSRGLRGLHRPRRSTPSSTR